jgi:3-carboxy-cis,cis-muconate cycloisomerase
MSLRKKTRDKNGNFMNSLLSPLFSTPQMEHIFSSENTINAMLRVELALSKAWGLDCEKLEMLSAKDFDLGKLGREGMEGSNINIPFVKDLKRLAGNQHHKGATSQDILDTACVLQLKEALGVLEKDLQKLLQLVHILAQKHITTKMCARTLLQPALPTTFGLKLALFYVELKNIRLEAPTFLQLGGAAGTQSAFTPEIAKKMAQELGLKESAPTHAYRSHIHSFGASFASLSIAMGKMANDITLLMQAEIGEVKEGAKEGRGGSSAMAHKRNPALSTLIKACALEAPPLLSGLYMSGLSEHERGAGAWQTEWLNLPLLVKTTASALQKSILLFETLEVDELRMLDNYETYLSPYLSENDKSILSAMRLTQHLLGIK